jgi:hypothetical protein
MSAKKHTGKRAGTPRAAPKRRRPNDTASSPDASQRASLRLVEPFDDTDAALVPEDEAMLPVEMPPGFFRTVGSGILNGRNPNQMQVRETFMRFILEKFLPEMKAQIEALEAQARADRRAMMSAIPGNPSVRRAAVKARRAARTEARKHFAITQGGKP